MRPVQVQGELGKSVHSVELDDEVALYSHTNYDAAEHYFQMLTQPLGQVA